jgi:UDP-N-acetylglucosamine--N-acetylmuramyl-(pentapeptide) pyrophosphoryl-undecaprenol N-acetylglucosamine transferase
MRLLVTGGGTGGHVYPALAVLESLLAEPAWETRREDVAWVGAAHSLEERILTGEGLTFYPIASGAVRGAGGLRLIANLAQTLKGCVQALALLGRIRPQAVLATGGYVSVPLVVAAWTRRCPVLIYLPDMAPGLAVRFLAHLARRVAVSFDKVATYFAPGKALVSGYPVRQALFTRTRLEARRNLGLQADVPMLLVLGGSRGARSINQAIVSGLSALLERAQVVHVSGMLDYERLAEERNGLSAHQQERYRLYAYLNQEMVDALVAADLVIARAGAATLGEFPAVGLPSILVPYPFSGQHQQPNADYMASRGAALTLADAALGEQLVPTVLALLEDPDRLHDMAQAARVLAQPEAARCIAAELVRLSQGDREAKRDSHTQ